METSATFTVTFLSDVILSERAATTGGHRTLDYIPGAAFLGMAAASLYGDERTKGKEYELFHSGAVRFGYGYPLCVEGKGGLPIPLPWRYEKGEEWRKGAFLTNLWNLSELSLDKQQAEIGKGTQFKEIKEGYFTSSGEFLLPEKRYRMKTAIDRESGGRPKDTQLFGYESLARGSRWSFTVEVDEELAEFLPLIKSSLVGQRRLGRSKSAEYGSVQIEADSASSGDEWSYSDRSDSTLIYCVSDLHCRTRGSGRVTLTPEPEELGIPDPDATIDHERTYLKRRVYHPFNGARGAHDLSREVIAKGSVIAIKTSVSPDELRKAFACGIGMNRHEGLGKVLVNPSFLSGGAKVDYSSNGEKSTHVATGSETPKATTPLTRWAARKLAAREAMVSVEGKAFDGAKRIEKVRDQQLPSAAQWRKLKNALAGASGHDEIIRILFDPKTGMMRAGVGSRAWQNKVIDGGKRTPLWEVIKKFVDEWKDDELVTALRLFAEIMAHRAAMPKKGEGNE